MDWHPVIDKLPYLIMAAAPGAPVKLDVSDIIRSLVTSAIVAAVTMYGTTRVMEVEISQLKVKLDKLEVHVGNAVEKLNETTTRQAIGRQEHIDQARRLDILEKRRH